MTTTAFQVKTDVFEGPLDLLLDLIEKRKLHINDVSLAAVADDYIQHVGTLNTFPTHDAAHFILLASTLLLIKSKSLLPTFDLTPEEQADVHELEHRLRLYKRMRALSRHVRERFGVAVLFQREEPKDVQPVFAPDPGLSLHGLHTAAQTLIQQFPKVERLTQVIVDKVISLEDMIDQLAERIKSNVKMSFTQFAKNGEGDRAEKVNLIVSFLAMLELVKQGMIAVAQDQTFADIEMETQEITTPNYS